MKKIYFLIISAVMFTSVYAQEHRYREEVFTDVKVTKDVVYGVNATAITLIDYGQALAQPLVMDIYEPVGDIEEIRPLIIYFHSGNFLPYPINQSVVGTHRDSSVVAFCKQLARCGYVVASADYRLGWNPVALTDFERRFGIINAAYRGVQDANTCIRFFRESAQIGGNPYRICEGRIALFGDDTGGYLSVHAAVLSQYSDILTNPELWIPDGMGGFIPMVIEPVNGDVEGKKYGVNSIGFPPFPLGDTLCYPNLTRPNSSFNVAVNLGGAVAYKDWIKPGQPPIISIHTPYDFTTPCGQGPVFVPPDLYVMTVWGSCEIAAAEEATGNTDLFDNVDEYFVNDFQQSVEDMAISRNGGLNSLLLIKGDTITDINPWVFWDRATNLGDEEAIKKNPHMSPEKAALYRDTILAYVLPRLYIALDIDKPITSCMTKTEFISPDAINIHLSPNPTRDHITVTTPDSFIIRNISLFNTSGNQVFYQGGIDGTEYHMNVANQAPGIYMILIQSDDGVVPKRIYIQ